MNKKKPLVSVIIPSYNHQDYVIEALESVKQDQYDNKEVVIIDDGSRDNSTKLIQDWINLNDDINVNFESRPNKGVCATLNELVRKAKGKYLVILASDDALCNNTIAERVSILENRTDKLVLISDAEGIDSKGNVIYKSIMSDFHHVDKVNYQSSLLDEIIFRFGISGAVVMANKEIYKLIGYYPENLKAEDLFFYLRAASIKKVIFQDIIVSKYRIHNENTSGSNPELTKTVIKTYWMTLRYIPSLYRKIKLLKRIAGLYLYSFLRNR